MAETINKSIEISLKVLGDVGPQFEKAAKGLDKIISSLKPFNNEIGNFKKSLESILSPIEKLGQVNKLPALNALSKGLESFSKVNLDPIVSKINSLSASLTNIPAKTVEIKFNNVTKVMKDSQQSMNDTSKTASKLGESLKGVGQKIDRYFQYRIIADAVIGAMNAFKSGIESIVDFDQGLKNLQAITSATSEEVGRMGEKIKQVATDTKFSTTEIADGMVILGQAGLSASESIQTIDAVSNLAAGTLTEMATTVDLVTTAMRVFDIEAKNSGQIADVFANAVNKSKLTIDKLRTAMNYVGPVAHEAGLSLEETSAAMMTLANSGLRASTIGTSARRFISELVSTSDKLADAATNAGISLDQLDTGSNGLSSVIKNLKVLLTDTKTGVIDTGLAFELFGKRGAAGVLALVKQTEDGTFVFDEMSRAVARTGTAQRMAEIQLTGLKVGYKNLTDRIKVFAVALGEAGITGAMTAFLNVAKEAVDWLTKMVTNGFIPAIAKGITFTAILTGILVGISAMAPATIAWVTSLFALTTHMSATTAVTYAFGTAVLQLATKIGALSAALLANPLFWGGIALATLTYAATQLFYFSGAAERATKEVERNMEAAIVAQAEYKRLGDSVNDYKNQLNKLEELRDTDNLEYQKQHYELIHKLISEYPDYASEIINASGSLTALSLVLSEIQPKLKMAELQKGLTVAEGYGAKINKARKELKELDAVLALNGNQKNVLGINQDTVNEANERALELRQDMSNQMDLLVLEMKKQVESGQSVDFVSLLGVDTFKEAYARVEKITSDSYTKQEKFQKAITLSAQQYNSTYVKEAKERAIKHKESLEKIATEEALGVKTHAQALKDRDIAQVLYREREVQLAQDTLDRVTAIEQKEGAEDRIKAEKKVLEAQKNLAADRLKLLVTYGNEADTLSQKLVTNSDRETSEIEKNNLKIESIDVETNAKRLAEMDKFSDAKQKLEKTLSDRVAEINHKAFEKLKGFEDDRLQAAQKANASIIGIHESVAEKIRAINQRSITENEKQFDNATTADKKLVEGNLLVEEAKRTQDLAQLARGQKLIDQAGELYNGLKDVGLAVAGLDAVKNAQINAADAVKDIELDIISQKEQTVEKERQRDIQIARELHDFKLEKNIEEHVEALVKIKDRHAIEMTTENIRHTNKMDNIQKEHDKELSVLNDIREKQQNIINGPVLGPSGVSNPESTGSGDAVKIPIEPYIVNSENLDLLIEENMVKLSELQATKVKAFDTEFTTGPVQGPMPFDEYISKFGLLARQMQEFKSDTANVDDELGRFGKNLAVYGKKISESEFSLAVNGLSNMFTDIAFEGKSASEAFADFGKEFVKTLTGMITKMMAYAAIASGMRAMGFAASIPAFAFAGGGLAFADGGKVSGPGSGTSDSINAKLSHGEYVMTAKETSKWLPVLEIMRRGKFGDWLKGMNFGNIMPRIPSVPSFASGGLATASSGGMGSFDINIINNSKEDLQAETGEPRFDQGAWIIDIVLDAASRNKAGFRTNLKSIIGS